MELNNSQKSRIQNLEYIQYSASLLGSIAGVIYSHKTGGGFWRGVGYWIVGGVTLGLVSALVVTPFKNKILKEDVSDSTSDKSSTSDKNKKSSDDKSEIIVKNDSPKLSLDDWHNLILKGNELESKYGQPNPISKLIPINSPSSKKAFENFINNVSMDEMDAIMSFLNMYIALSFTAKDKGTKKPSEKNVMDAIGDDKSKLVKSGMAKIFGLTQNKK